MDMFKRNDAVQVNGPLVNGDSAQVALTDHGSDWYFAVCAVMTVSMFTFLGLGLRKGRRERLFHYITAGVVMVAAVAYFTMGSHLGWTPIRVEFQRSDPVVAGITREIYYARYVDWAITTPLLLLDLMLTAAMPIDSILFIILVDEVMIVTGLIGALTYSSYKFGYFVFGCFALFYIAYELLWTARRRSAAISKDVGNAFLYGGVLTTFLWFLYPIAWGLSEGGNVISCDGEAVFYGVLDLLAKPGFGAILIWGHRNVDPAILGLDIKDYVLGDAVYHDKKRGHNDVGPNVNPTTNGTNGVQSETV